MFNFIFNEFAMVANLQNKKDNVYLELMVAFCNCLVSS